jgi:DNA polymerase-3 subunit gamma/tau
MEIVAQLERIVASENIAVEKEVLFAIAKASDGSLRDAESVLDQLVSFSEKKISLKDIISVLGLVEEEALFEITDKIIQKDALAALGLLNSLIDEGKDTGVLLAGLIEHFRNLMVARISKGDSKLIDLPEDACQRLLRQSGAFTLEEIFSAFNILVNTQEMAKRLDSLRIPLEICLVRLAQGKKGSETFIKDKILPAASQKEEVATEPADPPAQSVSLDNIKGAWQSVINNLEKVKMSVATYLNEGEPIKVQGNVLTVSFPKNYSLHKESLERKENKAIIEKSLCGLFNAAFKVNFILSEQGRQKEDNGNSPFIKSALEMFEGRVIKEE